MAARARIVVDLNPMMLAAVDKYAADQNLNRDFVIAVALDQFLSDPANQVAS